MKTKTMTSQLIDESVIFTMIICAAISLIALAFRYKNSEPLHPVMISVKSGTIYTDELVKFTATGIDILPTTRLYWEFGDKSNLNDTGISVIHYFKIPGRYDVRLTINEKRYEYKSIIVAAAPKAVDKRKIAQFAAPEKIVVGKPVIFKDLTTGANKWEWSFGETFKTDASTRVAKYIYHTQGTKRVKLVVNNDIVGEMLVYVEAPKATNPAGPNGPVIPIPVDDRPEHDPLPGNTNTDSGKKDSAATVAPPPHPVAPPLSNPELEQLFRQVVEGKKTAADFAQFIEPNRRVTAYLNERGMTLEGLCQKLREIKAGKVKSLKVTNVKKSEYNFIREVHVELETKKVLGIFKTN